ncbi:hypothetical protein BDW02DRAFT_626565 [Decorospora gaudefroyi]|uniref:DUF7918 domain-containing protein n=1 Tax=Decorospora gaudefroyi TaxID=184978 RepID=A0A6A5KQ11_9PLEO|nr:hypothetical protein BDW02DRAFT_626565 [Decorospora gaudefroyi]
MAVLPSCESCPGLTVEVCVDDKALPEYDDEANADGSDSVTKYVEAQLGSEIFIRSAFTEAFQTKKDVGLDFYVDGNWISGRVISRAKLLEPGDHVDIVNGVETKIGDKWLEHNLRFAELVFADSEEGCLMKEVALLGTIEVVLEFGKRVKIDIFESGWELPNRGIGTEWTIDEPKCRHWKGDGTGPFTTFIFKYRTRGDLQALPIIPRTPSPIPAAELKPDLTQAAPAVESPSLARDVQSASTPPALRLSCPAPVPILRANTGSMTPAIQQPNSASRLQPRLTKKEFLVLITNDDSENTPIQHEPAAPE